MARHHRALFVGAFRVGFATTALLLSSSCFSVKKMAVKQAADALAAGGDTFASDEDAELVKQAVPFSLKLMESLLVETPDHRGLLLACCSGFTQYAYAFVHEEADEVETTDYAAADVLRARARKLYRRARDYGLRGLEAGYPGLRAQLTSDPRAALARVRKSDVPLLYWTAAAWGSYVALNKDDPALIGELPQVEALVDRAYALDADWGAGAIHGLLISIEMNRSGGTGKAAGRARAHFEKALALSGGELAGPLVTFAETVSVETRDAAEFERLLQQALAIDVDRKPEHRLANTVMQRRARWLLSRKDDLFFSASK